MKQFNLFTCKFRFVIRMINYLIVLRFFLIGGSVINAQDHCGHDSILIQQKQIDTATFRNSIIEVNESIRNYINNHNNQHAPLTISSNAQYVIPVVIHIVRNPSDPVGAISYAQVESQIDALNKAFAMGYPGYNSQTHGSYAKDTRIQFCLAQNPAGSTSWTNSSEPGVMRYNDAVRAQNSLTIASTNDLLDLTHPGLTSGSSSYFPFQNYLNIWVVQSIDGLCSGVQGYSVNPIFQMFGIGGYLIDGVVIRADVFGDNSTGNSFTLQPHNFYGGSCPTATSQRQQGKILAHEVGHYLSLLHTFQTDILTGVNCAGGTSISCDMEGDFLCDTPPSNINSPSLPTFNCTGTRNTCNETYAPYLANYSVTTINPDDQVENYMYYSFDPCLNTFTEDQADRMEAFLNLYRSELFSVSNQISTGILGPTGCIAPTLLSNIYYTTALPNSSICINNNVNFNTDQSPANTAMTFSWSFTGGTPSTSTVANPNVTYTTPGSYLVILTTSDGINTSSTTIEISVSSCAPITEYSQSSWHFGQYGAVDFFTGIPVANNSVIVPLTMYSQEACVTQNDPNSGATIFYTDGIDVWNGSHQQFNTLPLGGNQVLNSNPVTGIAEDINSSAQILSLPFPGHNDMYYVIIPPALEDGNIGLRFAIIDMNLFTGGVQGSVVSQGLLPDHSTNTSGTYTEGITAIPHCNGVDYWIITHGIGTNRRFYVFLLSSVGLTNSTLTSNLPDAYGLFSQSTNGSVSNIKASPDGSRIALSNYSNFSVADYQFNNSTGVISSQLLLTTTGTERFYYCSYSPNSNYLYATSFNFSRITQFELSTGNSSVVLNTTLYLNQPKIGPDGKIYIPGYNTDLGSIDFPDVLGTTSFTPGAVSFSSIPGSLPRIQLPNIIDAVQTPATTPSFTVNFVNCSTAVFTVDQCWQNYSASWNFGDGSPIATGNSVTHTFTTTNTFTVTLTLTAPLLTTPFIVTQPVSTFNGPITITGPTGACLDGGLVQYSAPLVAGATYVWTVSSNGNIVGPTSGSFIDVDWTSGASGTVSLTINNGSCSSTGSINVVINPSPTITASPSPAYVCPPGGTVTLTAVGASTYFWSFGSTTISGNSITDNPLADQTYSVVGTDVNGCQSSTSILVSVYSVCPCTGCTDLTTTGTLSVSPPSNQIYCVNINTTINGTVTITNSDLTFAANVKLIVPSGSSLTIDKCRLFSCGTDMWDGIEIQSGGNLIMQNKSLIEDAKIGVLSDNSTGVANFHIEKSTFNRNHVGVKVVYHTTGTPHPGTIISTTFESQPSVTSTTNTNLLDAPYSLQSAEYGVELFKVNSITIGNSTFATDKNYFGYLKFGIRADVSTYSAINNEFKDMYPSLSTWAIWNTDCQATIGGYLINQPNNFENLYNGILHIRSSRLEVYKNTFTNIVSPPSFLKILGSIAVFTRDFEGGTIILNDNVLKNIETGFRHQNSKGTSYTAKLNQFKDFSRWGIFGLQNQTGTILVSNNNFNQSVTSTFTGNIAVNFSNAVVPLSSSPSLTVSNNSIYRIKKGIEVISYNKPTINNNTVGFPTTVNTSFLHYGIRTLNSDAELIKANSITKAGAYPTVSFLNKVYGISVEGNVSRVIVTENTVQRLGEGLRFRGYNNFNSLVSCNKMNNNWSGVTLDIVKIGDQGSSILSSPPNGVANDNQWTNPAAISGSLSVRGLSLTTPFATFYTRFASYPWCPSAISIFAPGSITTSTNSPLATIPNAPANCPNICYNPPCIFFPLVKMAENQSPYDVISGDEKFLLHQGLLKTILADSTIETDTSIEATKLRYYRDTTLANTEIGKLAIVADSISKGDTTFAQNLNALVFDSRCAETYQKTVNEIYLRTWARNQFFLKPSDSLTLQLIAYEDPAQCGPAVYDARVMVGLDLNDFSLEMRNDTKPQEVEMIIGAVGVLYPNPAYSSCVYEAELETDQLGKVEIFNINGSIIETLSLVEGFNKLEVNLKNYENGVYIFKISVNDELIETKRLVITK
jgi:hypothetical protein